MPTIRRARRFVEEVEPIPNKFMVRFWKYDRDSHFGFRNRLTVAEAVFAFFREYSPTSLIGKNIEKAEVIDIATERILYTLNREQLLFYYASYEEEIQ